MFNVLFDFLLIRIYNNHLFSILNRFNRVFECGLNFHYDDVLLLLVKQQNREINQPQQPKQYIDHQDDTNTIKLDEFCRNALSILVIGLTSALFIFIIEVV